MAQKQGPMSRNFVFTINMKEEDSEVAIYPDLDWPDLRYVAYQEELGGKNHTHHIQGMVQFLKPKRITQLAKLPGLERAWIQRMRGTPQQARDYALKQDDTAIKGTNFEYGNFCAGSGERVDIKQLRQKVKTGASMKDLFEDDETVEAAFRYQQGTKAMMSAYNAERKRDFKTQVEVYFGAPGTGKTRKAYEENPGLFMKPHTKWWDQYNFEEVVLLDDFYGWYPYHQLLILLDRYACPVEVKGGYINIAPKKVIITSNKPINEWYDDKVTRNLDALTRRVDKFIWFHDGQQKVFEGSNLGENGTPEWYSKFQRATFVRVPRNEND